MIFTKKVVNYFIRLHLNSKNCSTNSVHLKTKVCVNDDSSLIRNIGILAHIDAGKTTTTERMLFFSGSIKQMGEVHHGNTVTDFMEQERERGITITSASVTFQWDKHKINLLDTPGHIDFTMEVEQTLSVMDGAIVILDASAGVEAQTITVWKQANRHNIPRIIYINKMDKAKADLITCEASIQKQLGMTPLTLQLPVFEGNVFKGVVDLLNFKQYKWENVSSSIHFTHKTLQPEDGEIWGKSSEARRKLIESLADFDDGIAEEIIMDEKKAMTMSHAILKESIRKICLEQKAIPVLCGSSYKNIGVHCLLDGVINFLPSPLCSESSKIKKCFGNILCAKAFKVRHDNFKGPVTFFRIYSGNMKKGQKLYNMRVKRNDECNKLFVPYADEYEEIAEIGAGNVVAVTGLKETNIGDTVASSASAVSSIQTSLEKDSMKNIKESLFTGAFIPDPVFFCSIEAASMRQQSALDKALAELTREDPSLRLTISDETGQTVIGGMGELHLDIIKDRIKKEYKVDVDLGPLQIAYREKVLKTAKDSFNLKHEIGNSTQFVNITMSTVISKEDKKDRLLFDKSPDCSQNLMSIKPRHISAIKTGVERALAYGPKLSCPVMGVNAMLHYLEVGKGTPDSIVTSATTQCLKKLVKEGGTTLLEPIMKIEIVCTDKELQSVINDLGRRRAEIQSTSIRGTDLVIRGLVPLSELLGYATDLRIFTSGRAFFSMEFHNFSEMTAEEEAKAIKSVTGF